MGAEWKKAILIPGSVFSNKTHLKKWDPVYSSKGITTHLVTPLGRLLSECVFWVHQLHVTTMKTLGKCFF
jgi:hypothetical protein